MSTATVRKDRVRRGRRSNNKAQVSRFAGDAYSLAERAVKGVKFLSKLINIETKFADFIANTGVTTTPIVVYVSALAQGLDISNRVGDSIRLQGLQYAFSISVSLLCTGPNWIRILLVRDLQNQGAAPVLTDVLTGLSSVALPNYIQSSRYNILYDETVAFVREVGPMVDIRKGTIPLNGHVKYRSTSAAAASAAEGSLFLMAVSSLAVNNPSLDYCVRLTYTDD